MSVDRQRGELIFICDACGEVVEMGSDFDRAWAALAADGWIAIKATAGCDHLCPACSVAHR